MPKSPTPNSSLSGSIRPRTMFLSISSTRTTSPSTHMGVLSNVATQPCRGWATGASSVAGPSASSPMRRLF
jgi:hypothetical protein